MSISKKRKASCVSSNEQSKSLDTKTEQNINKELKKNSVPIKGYLSNCDIFLHPASLSSKRKTLFENQIHLNGGNIIKDLSCMTNYKEPFVLIDDNLIDRTRIDLMIKKVEDSAKSLSIQFIAIRWLSSCLEKSCFVEPGHQFLLKSDTKIQKHNHDTGNVDSKTIDETIKPGDKERVSQTVKHGFVCAHSSNEPRKGHNDNELIISELSKLASTYKNSNDQWRSYAYEKAIAAIKRHPNVISSREEAANIRGVGGKTADKIAEILSSGQLQKAVEVCTDEKAQVVDIFNRIWGVGPSTAEQWYYQGMRTLDDLKKADTEHENFLNRHQKIGLELFEDLDQRMSRTEAAEIEAYIRQSVLEIDKNFEIIACGSYRRGKETCGDLDVLITHPNGIEIQTDLIEKIIAKLHNEHFLTHDLTLQKDGSQKKYLGVCKLIDNDKSKHRRLDIILVPPNEKATALMYFTGSAHFNRSMRLLATKSGMSLSEHSLRKNIIRGGQGKKEKLNKGTILSTPTEESVFEHLGLTYRPPSERNH